MSPAGPSEAVRRRILTAVRARPMPPRAVGAQSRGTVLAAGVLYLAGGFVLLGGVVQGARPTSSLAAVGVAWGVVAAAVTWIGMVRGRSMLGRSVVVRGWLALAVTPALAILALVASVAWGGAGAGDSGGIRAHAACFALTLLLSIGPFAACMAVRRGSEPVAPRRVGAGLGAVAGVWAGLAMDLHCSRSSVTHGLWGHVLPVFFATVAGFAVGGRVLSLRR